MRNLLLVFGLLASSASFSQSSPLEGWKDEVASILAGPEGAGKYVKVCVREECIVSNRLTQVSMRVAHDLDVGEDEFYKKPETEAGGSGEDGVAASGGSHHSRPALAGASTISAPAGAPAAVNTTVDRIVDRLGKLGSASGEITVHYEEKTTNADGSSKEMKVDVTIKGGVGGGGPGAGSVGIR